MKLAWADYAAVQAQCGNLSGNELTSNLSRNIRPQSFQLAEPLWTDPGIKNGISVHELISTSKKKKKGGGKRKSAGREWRIKHSPKNPRKWGNSHCITFIPELPQVAAGAPRWRWFPVHCWDSCNWSRCCLLCMCHSDLLTPHPHWKLSSRQSSYLENKIENKVTSFDTFFFWVVKQSDNFLKHFTFK